MDDESFSWVSRSHLKIKMKGYRINLLLHKDIENSLTVNFRPLDSVMLNRPIIPRGFFFSPWSPSSLYQDYTLLTFQFYLSVHPLPSIFSSRIYRTFRHSVFPLCPSRFPLHPSSCSMPLDAASMDCTNEALLTSDFQFISANRRYQQEIRVGRKREVGIFISSAPPS